MQPQISDSSRIFYRRNSPSPSSGFGAGSGSGSGFGGAGFGALGAAAAYAYLGLGEAKPTAVAAFNDRCALGFIDVVRQAGVRVPEDVSVVGFDDIRQAAYDHVGLTTVQQDAQQLGAKALERVTARLDHDDTATQEVVVEPSLVVRRSTAPPHL